MEIILKFLILNLQRSDRTYFLIDSKFEQIILYLFEYWNWELELTMEQKKINPPKIIYIF